MKNRLSHTFGTAVAGIAIFGLVGVASIAARPVSAQDATPVATPAPATIYVNGNGTVTIAPDTASVVVGVNVIQPTLSEAQAQATDQMNSVIAALKAAGIADKDIQTTNYSVSILQDYDNNGNPAKINGFQVNNQVSVTVRDLTALGDLLDTVVAQGANSIYGISFFVDDSTPAATQARKLAVNDATRKAKELAEAAGMSLGRIVSISETSGPTPPPTMFAEAAMDSVAKSVPIQAGSSSVSVDVQITFEVTS